MKCVLYRLMDWGLGHATRSLPLIRGLISAGHCVTVATSGRALGLLQAELGDRIEFEEFPQLLPTSWGRDYHWLLMLYKLPWLLPMALRSVDAEKRQLETLLSQRRFDLIVSDNCYGSWSDEMPCYFLSHHLKIHWFTRTPALQRLNEWVVSRWINRFSHILVPDDRQQRLAGNLAWDFRFIDDRKVSYIGILSDLERLATEEDLDYFIPISGCEPQRTNFERLVLAQARSLRGRVVVALGKPEGSQEPTHIGDNITVYEFCDRRMRNELFNRAKVVVARFGYTTVMDLLELEKKNAVLVPTPNQPEQEYLACYHRERGSFYSVNQRRLDLPTDAARAIAHRGTPTLQAGSTKASVDRFMHLLAEEGAI